jgi:hypothetical protein
VVLGCNLKAGTTKSCGCFNKEQRFGLRARHRRSKTLLYYSYRSMLSRCQNPNVKCYQYYGGIGVRVCARWSGKDGFENFLADMGERPPGTSLDRKDPWGNYEPGNCRWATPLVQGRNKRKHVRQLELVPAYLGA